MSGKQLSEHLTLQSGLLGLAVVCTGMWYYQSRKRKRNFPPGPPGIPIMGNLKMMARNPTLYKDFMKLAEEYGDVFSLQLGSYPSVVLNGHAVIKEAFVRNGHCFVDRPNWMYIIKKNTGQKGVIMQNGAHWSELRKMTSLSMRNFGVGGNKLETRIMEEARTILGEIEKESHKTKFSLHHIMGNAIANIICFIAFGISYEYDNKDFQHLLEQLDYFFRRGGMQNIENFIPILRFIPFKKNPYAEKAYGITQNIRKFISTQIDGHRQSFDPENIRDFIDLYLQAEGSEQGAKGAKTEENIFRTITDLFLGGSESTSTTLLWGFLFMVLNPEAQKKCRQQIHERVGKDRQIQMSDWDNLPYLHATISEVHRRCSAAPLSVPRSVNKEVKLRGYTLPKDTIVMTNLYSVHMDPKVWDSPEEFRPERFLDDSGNVIHHEALMPFSIGRRACIGEPLAKMEMFLIMGAMLQKFEFKMADPSNPPSTEGIQGIALAPKDYDIVVEQV